MLPGMNVGIQTDFFQFWTKSKKKHDMSGSAAFIHPLLSMKSWMTLQECRIHNLVTLTNTKCILIWKMSFVSWCVQEHLKFKAYCDQVQECGHWLVLGDLEGQVGLVDLSPLGVLVDLGGLRGKGDRHITVMMRYVKKNHNLKDAPGDQNDKCQEDKLRQIPKKKQISVDWDNITVSECLLSMCVFAHVQ